jgi:protein TonB
MDRSDWIGAGTSVGLHLILAVLFGFITATRPPQEQLGYVEVEFGEFSSGRPVEAAEEAPETSAPEEPQEPQPEPEEEPEPETTPDPEPVEEPEQDPPSDETIPPTEEEATPPEPQEEQEQSETAEEQEPSQEPGENEGDPGTGTAEEKSAPYNIEGLDRDPVFAPLPDYNANVNARIRVRITVNPQGRIVRRVPLIKGNPQLEASVMDALQRWRFNALPPGAPQESQTGTITFTFRLE